MIGLLLRTAGQRVLLSNPHHGVLGSRLCKLMVGRVCFHSITRNRFICTRCFKELSVTKEITFLPARRLKMFPGLMWGVSRRFAVTRVGSKGHSASSMRNKTTAIYIIALAVTVVGASYLAVPLYRLYCQVKWIWFTVLATSNKYIYYPSFPTNLRSPFQFIVLCLCCSWKKISK